MSNLFFLIGDDESLEHELYNRGNKVVNLYIDTDKTYSENMMKMETKVRENMTKGYTIGIIGIGVGGFYASRLAERIVCKSVLVDSVVDAYREIEWEDDRVAESYYPALVTTVTFKPLLLQSYKNGSVERFYATEAIYYEEPLSDYASIIINHIETKFTFNELLNNILV